MSPNEVEVELLEDRVDSLVVANDELRDRLAELSQQITAIAGENERLVKRNRELSAHIDRLALHVSQGVEL